MIALFASTILVIPLWMRLVPRLGRHRVWAVSLIANALSRPLVLLLTPGQAAIWPMLALICLSAVLMAPWNFAPPSMLSDVIDYDLWKSRTNKAGNLFALNTLLVKASMAIGAGGAFILLDAFHYQAGKTNSGTAELGMLICYLAIPAAFHILAGLLAWQFPLNEKRQAIVRKRLEHHAAGAGIA
jgi:Na+/melibiose symporter-like transporter